MSEVFPNDADGDVLRSLKENNFDFEKTYDVDFYCWAHDLKTANEISRQACDNGYKSKVSVDDEEENPLQKHSVYMTMNITLPMKKSCHDKIHSMYGSKITKRNVMAGGAS